MIQDFQPGDRVEWQQDIDGVEFRIEATVEVVAQDMLTVRDSLGRFWQVQVGDAPVKIV
jgi:hypothetical protein